MNWDEMALDSLAFGMVISILGYQLGLFLKEKVLLGDPESSADFHCGGPSFFLLAFPNRLRYLQRQRSVSELSADTGHCVSGYPAVPADPPPEGERKGDFPRHRPRGVLTSLGSILGLSVLFGLNHEQLCDHAAKVQSLRPSVWASRRSWAAM